MKTRKSILVAFILNLSFSVFELFGGLYTGSVAIVSDALHDFGDAASIGVAYLLEKKSDRSTGGNHTGGYDRYSLIGGIVINLMLLVGSFNVIINAVGRLFNPVKIDYGGMMVFAVVGFCVNLCAAFFTRHGDSPNQKAVNLHMLEDVLGWAVVLVGAVVMRFTDLSFIDPVMSIGVAVFILISAFGNLREMR